MKRDNLNIGMIGALLFVLVFWTVIGVVSYTYYSDDYTDTGVGCIDDCLEPLIEDEAQTEISKERN